MRTIPDEESLTLEFKSDTGGEFTSAVRSSHVKPGKSGLSRAGVQAQSDLRGHFATSIKSDVTCLPDHELVAAD